MSKQVNDLASLYGSYIDKPMDPNARGSLQSPALNNAFNRIVPPSQGYTRADFGELQQNPGYRGIRMVLPQSGGSYFEGQNYAGADAAQRGMPRIMPQGPPNQPDPNDPHHNGIPRYPPNMPPDRLALQQAVYGEMIRRGYPVLGGTGEMGGDFQPGFNPIGFGSR